MWFYLWIQIISHYICLYNNMLALVWFIAFQSLFMYNGQLEEHKKKHVALVNYITIFLINHSSILYLPWGQLCGLEKCQGLDPQNLHRSANMSACQSDQGILILKVDRRWPLHSRPATWQKFSSYGERPQGRELRHLLLRNLRICQAIQWKWSLRCNPAISPLSDWPWLGKDYQLTRLWTSKQRRILNYELCL